MTEDARCKIIFIGAHPDDPETACGGTMALLSQTGHEVVAAYLTRGEAGIPGKSHIVHQKCILWMPTGRLRRCMPKSGHVSLR